MGAPTFPRAQNPAKCLDGMRFLLVQPWERKNESKQVLERLHNTRRAGKWDGNPRVDSCRSQHCLEAPAASLFFFFLVPIDWSWPRSARAQLDDYSFPYPFHHF